MRYKEGKEEIWVNDGKRVKICCQNKSKNHVNWVMGK